MVVDEKSSEEPPVNVEISKVSILASKFFLLCFIDLPDDATCNIVICADDFTLYYKCDQGYDLWQQLELASELESDLQDIVDQGMKCLVDFNAGKSQLVLLDWSNNTGAIDFSVVEKKSSFKLLLLTFSSKLDWGSYITSIIKTTSKEIGALIGSMKSLFPEIVLYQ